MSRLSDKYMLIIGVGNPYRNDDQAGLIAARRLKKKESVHHFVDVEEHDGEGTALIELWKEANHVILLDAMLSGVKPGTIYRFDAIRKPLPNRIFRYSTHAFGPGDGIELARRLKRLPKNLIVFGIEGKNFEAGERVSTEVSEKIDELIERVVKEIRSETL